MKSGVHIIKLKITKPTQYTKTLCTHTHMHTELFPWKEDERENGETTNEGG